MKISGTAFVYIWSTQKKAESCQKPLPFQLFLLAYHHFQLKQLHFILMHFQSILWFMIFATFLSAFV